MTGTVVVYLLLGAVIALAQIAVILAVISLPVIFVFVSRHDDGGRHMGRLLIGAGMLLGFHLTVTAAWGLMLMRVPMLLDPHPFDNLIQITLNWTIPAGLAGIPLGLVLRKTAWSNSGFAIGAILLSGVTVGFVWYGNYFFGELLGQSLSEYVWWY